MKTYSTREGDIRREWHLIDAQGQTLGKLATRIAVLLMGKHKPIFSPNQDTGDYVVVINAAGIRVTGNKLRGKRYYRHSNYPGGMKSIGLEDLLQTKPTSALEHAVKGMLPHTHLGAKMLKKLRVYAGADHPHASQVTAAATAEKE